MKQILFVAVLAFLTMTCARADVTATLSGPSEILSNNIATFDAHIDITPALGKAGVELDGLSYMFYSGDGQTLFGSLGTGVVGSGSGGGGSHGTFDFFASFNYLVPGIYTPSFLLTAKTSLYDFIELPPTAESYTQYGGYYYQVSYACGTFYTSVCYETRFQEIDNDVRAGVVSPYNFVYNLTNQAFATTKLVVSVPEPESYAMMSAGLALLGIVARRRKQKNVC